MYTLGAIIGLLTLIVLCVIFLPLLLLWTLNALGLVVAYTFKTWFAAFIILCFFAVRSSS